MIYQTEIRLTMWVSLGYIFSINWLPFAFKLKRFFVQNHSVHLKMYYSMKGFARGLVLKQRLKVASISRHAQSAEDRFPARASAPFTDRSQL